MTDHVIETRVVRTLDSGLVRYYKEPLLDFNRAQSLTEVWVPSMCPDKDKHGVSHEERWLLGKRKITKKSGKGYRVCAGGPLHNTKVRHELKLTPRGGKAYIAATLPDVFTVSPWSGQYQWDCGLEQYLWENDYSKWLHIPKTVERPEDCPNVKHHYKKPRNYINNATWGFEMAKTHEQQRCDSCGYWSIWTPKRKKGKKS